MLKPKGGKPPMRMAAYIVDHCKWEFIDKVTTLLWNGILSLSVNGVPKNQIPQPFILAFFSPQLRVTITILL